MSHTVGFMGYKVHLSPGWSAIERGKVLYVRPDKPGISFELEKISSGGTTVSSFLNSDSGSFLSKEFSGKPTVGKSLATGVPFLFYRKSWRPDELGRLRAAYTMVLLFPRSVLIATIHCFSKISHLSLQLATEGGLIIQRTSETPRKSRRPGGTF